MTAACRKVTSITVPYALQSVRVVRAIAIKIKHLFLRGRKAMMGQQLPLCLQDGVKGET